MPAGGRTAFVRKRRIKLQFTKRDGKYDALVIERDDGTTESIACPKQGIIPHDMVHYAVESVLHHSGFLSLAGKERTSAPPLVRIARKRSSVSSRHSRQRCGAGRSRPPI
ncbi:hypothetical protein [Sphingomonas aliaeris]|uniref:hypothetical protein n=1 Tax=Sphingomonas aliaeris TaxID=2759526 RepID=UPI001CEC0474|nr:hypothetical protein [Sphingomonas aliaeris]